MCDTRVPSLIVIGTDINQLETKVSQKTICCLRLFVVVYKHVKLQHLRKLLENRLSLRKLSRICGKPVHHAD